MIAHSLEIGKQMTREQHRGAVFRDRRGQRRKEFPARERVERRDRFVEQQHAGPLPECERERDLRAHAPGQRLDPPIERDVQAAQTVAGKRVVPHDVHVPPQLEVVVRVPTPIERNFLREVADLAQELDIVGRRLARDGCLSGSRTTQSCEQPHQRRLPGTIRTDQPRDATGRDRERAVAQRPRLPVPLARARSSRSRARSRGRRFVVVRAASGAAAPRSTCRRDRPPAPDRSNAAGRAPESHAYRAAGPAGGATRRSRRRAGPRRALRARARDSP